MPSRTNTAMLRGGLLYAYVNSFGVYKCPADKTLIGGAVSDRCMSMNCWMNPIDSWNDYGGGHPGKVREFWKQTDITYPGPAMAFVFIDENPWCIDDDFFVCDPLKSVWISIPANYHNGAGGLSFADGHTEIKKRKDSHVLWCSATPPQGVEQDANTGNLLWLQDRSSSAL